MSQFVFPICRPEWHFLQDPLARCSGGPVFADMSYCSWWCYPPLRHLGPPQCQPGPTPCLLHASCCPVYWTQGWDPLVRIGCLTPASCVPHPTCLTKIPHLHCPPSHVRLISKARIHVSTGEITLKLSPEVNYGRLWVL